MTFKCWHPMYLFTQAFAKGWGDRAQQKEGFLCSWSMPGFVTTPLHIGQVAKGPSYKGDRFMSLGFACIHPQSQWYTLKLRRRRRKKKATVPPVAEAAIHLEKEANSLREVTGSLEKANERRPSCSLLSESPSESFVHVCPVVSRLLLRAAPVLVCPCQPGSLSRDQSCGRETDWPPLTCVVGPSGATGPGTFRPTRSELPVNTGVLRWGAGTELRRRVCVHTGPPRGLLAPRRPLGQQ